MPVRTSVSGRPSIPMRINQVFSTDSLCPLCFRGESDADKHSPPRHREHRGCTEDYPPARVEICLATLSQTSCRLHHLDNRFGILLRRVLLFQYFSTAFAHLPEGVLVRHKSPQVRFDVFYLIIVWSHKGNRVGRKRPIPTNL